MLHVGLRDLEDMSCRPLVISYTGVLCNLQLVGKCLFSGGDWRPV
jgi:hypothetical protein